MKEVDVYGGWIVFVVELLKFFFVLEYGVSGSRIILFEIFGIMFDKLFFEKDVEEWYGFGFDIWDNGSIWGYSG